jgi:hypothetical protein
MRISLYPAALFALLAVACSGGAESELEPQPSTEGASELALSADGDGADQAADKGRHRDGDRRRRGGRRHHHHPGGEPPPPPPAGASCDVAGQTFPDGSPVPSGDSCNSCSCGDGSVICTLALCEPVNCAAFIEQSDGVCSRFPLDPCISQDPDCSSDAGSCEAAGQTFPDGSAVPSGDSCNSCSCGDGSVICTLALCEPVACAAFLESSDGVCSRFPLDPCKSQDPDCLETEEASAP